MSSEGPNKRVAQLSMARKQTSMVPASSSCDCELGVHQTRVAAASKTCSVANVREGCPCATDMARADVRSGTNSTNGRTAPPCVKARCASLLADATLETSSLACTGHDDAPEAGEGVGECKGETGGPHVPSGTTICDRAWRRAEARPRARWREHATMTARRRERGDGRTRTRYCPSSCPIGPWRPKAGEAARARRCLGVRACECSALSQR